MTTANLSDAIGTYRADAAKLFDDAHDALAHPPAFPPPQPPPPPETLDAFRKRNQGQLAAAFSQLSTAETMSSSQTGRDGYAQVVALMKTTEVAADSLCIKLAAAANQLDVTSATLPEQLQIVEALTRAVQAVAQLSPSAVWQTAKSSDASG
jgi:hypothetical protein